MQRNANLPNEHPKFNYKLPPSAESEFNVSMVDLQPNVGLRKFHIPHKIVEEKPEYPSYQKSLLDSR
jgi:hypothetical protein